MAQRRRILVIDDEPVVCDVVREMMETIPEYHVTATSNPIDALHLLRKFEFDLVLTDLVMGKHSGMQMMELALTRQEDTIVILMTGYPTMENAIDALKHGAYDYLVKPFRMEVLKATVERGLRKQHLARENIHLREQLALYRVSEAMGSTIHLGTALNQVLKLTVKEFAADAASILFYDSESAQERFVLQAIHTTEGELVDHSFLEGRTHHSLLAAHSKEAEIENVHNPGRQSESEPESENIVTFLSCPLLVRGRVIGVLNLQRHTHYREFSPGELQCLKVIATKAAYAISNSRLYEDLQKSYLSTLLALANAVEARDHYTSGHTVRVTYLAELIARELGWDDDRLLTLTMGCSLHDIGKIGVPDSILNKPSVLNDQERQIMCRHTELGARIIEGISFLRACLPYIISHHEHWDGNGYPQGLKGENIPIEGRILAVADTFDAIVTERPYRPSRTIDQAIKELLDYSGTQFDPSIVTVFVEALQKNRDKINVIYNSQTEEQGTKTEREKTSGQKSASPPTPGVGSPSRAAGSH